MGSSPRQGQGQRAQRTCEAVAVTKRPAVLPPPPQKTPARTRVALPAGLPATDKTLIRKLKSKHASQNLRQRKRVYLAELEARRGLLEHEKLGLADAERQLRAEHAALLALAAERRRCTGPGSGMSTTTAEPFDDRFELEIDELFESMASRDSETAMAPSLSTGRSSWGQPSRSNSLPLPALPTPTPAPGADSSLPALSTLAADSSLPVLPTPAGLLGTNDDEVASYITLSDLFGCADPQHNTDIYPPSQTLNLNLHQTINPDTYRTRTPGATGETSFEHALFLQSKVSSRPSSTTTALSSTLAWLASVKQPLAALTTAMVAIFLASLTWTAATTTSPPHRTTSIAALADHRAGIGSTDWCANSGTLANVHQRCSQLLAKPPRPRSHPVIPV